MPWVDVVLVMVVAVLANHMGLIEAIENIVHRKLLVLNCSKCLTFWLSIICCSLESVQWTLALATSFTAAYTATWLELFFGFLSKQYEKIYYKIYPEAEAGTSAANSESAAPGLSDVREIK